MKIYIPPHLRSLELINMFCRMISEYAKYREDYVSSFSDFYSFYLKSDPVKKFISLMIPIKENQEEGDYEDQISYITSLFYCIKGTPKVLEEMVKYFSGSITFEGPLRYDGTYLEIIISEVTGIGDENLFYTSFMNFLGALLYFDPSGSNIVIERTVLKIGGDLKSNISSDIINYLEYYAD